MTLVGESLIVGCSVESRIAVEVVAADVESFDLVDPVADEFVVTVAAEFLVAVAARRKVVASVVAGEARARVVVIEAVVLFQGEPICFYLNIN